MGQKIVGFMTHPWPLALSPLSLLFLGGDVCDFHYHREIGAFLA